MAAPVTKTIATEAGHWYHQDGQPCYEVPYADPRKGMRNTTLTDARKLKLVPSFTTIVNVAAKPGLINWKARNILYAALTLPRKDGESLDDYADRVMEDADAQSAAARDRGTELHTAIEKSLAGEAFDPYWTEHIANVRVHLAQLGIDWEGNSEKSFCHPRGYGGKCDLSWNAPGMDLPSGIAPNVGLLDFKTKDKIVDGVLSFYDEHIMQLAAYSHGLFRTIRDVRALNVFVGVDDKQVRTFEYTFEQLQRGWLQFNCLLNYWYITTGLER